jgi:hypothetical protein
MRVLSNSDRVTIDEIEALVSIARLGGFARAVEALHRSQPEMGRCIRNSALGPGKLAAPPPLRVPVGSRVGSHSPARRVTSGATLSISWSKST